VIGQLSRSTCLSEPCNTLRNSRSSRNADYVALSGRISLLIKDEDAISGHKHGDECQSFRVHSYGIPSEDSQNMEWR